MTRFGKILVYVPNSPESDTAIEKAVALAKESQRSLQIIDVIGHESPKQLRDMKPIPLHLISRRKAELETYARSLCAQGLHVDVAVRFGRPSDEIVREAQSSGYDLVMKMANPKDGASRWRFAGDTAVRLLRACPSPVWITRREGQESGRVVAAINPIGEPEQVAMSDEIMAVAIDLAQATSSELHVIHAWDLIGVGVLGGRVSWEQIQSYAATIHRSVREALKEYLLGYCDHITRDGRIHTPRGNADEQIPDIAAAIGADVLVMGNFARAGLSGYVIGNTVEKVLPRLTTSVLAVKPEGPGVKARAQGQPSTAVAGSAMARH